MALKITRCAENPIVWPGKWDWRMSNAYNPGALYEDGRFFLYERTAGSLRPHICFVGLLESADGVHFLHVSDKPIFSPQMLRCPPFANSHRSHRFAFIPAQNPGSNGNASRGQAGGRSA